MRRIMEEPTEWRTWGMYAMSREGYLVIASIIPSGKSVGTYIIPRIVENRIPRYRLTRKGVVTSYKISELLKKVWGFPRTITVEMATEMRDNALLWNEARRDLREAEGYGRRTRLAKTQTRLSLMDDFGNEDPFMDPAHPQQDPFSNWR